MKKFSQAVVAGTFDHLHAGHKSLLTTAKKLSDRLAIGLTKPEFVVQKTLASLIEPFGVRRKNLKKFLGKTPNKVVSLKDPIGPAATSPDYDAIFASPETITNVKKINQRRQNLQNVQIRTIQKFLVLEL